MPGLIGLWAIASWTFSILAWNSANSEGQYLTMSSTLLPAPFKAKAASSCVALRKSALLTWNVFWHHYINKDVPCSTKLPRDNTFLLGHHVERLLYLHQNNIHKCQSTPKNSWKNICGSSRNHENNKSFGLRTFCIIRTYYTTQTYTCNTHTYLYKHVNTPAHAHTHTHK